MSPGNRLANPLPEPRSLRQRLLGLVCAVHGHDRGAWWDYPNEAQSRRTCFRCGVVESSPWEALGIRPPTAEALAREASQAALEVDVKGNHGCTRAYIKHDRANAPDERKSLTDADEDRSRWLADRRAKRDAFARVRGESAVGPARNEPPLDRKRAPVMEAKRPTMYALEAKQRSLLDDPSARPTPTLVHPPPVAGVVWHIAVTWHKGNSLTVCGREIKVAAYSMVQSPGHGMTGKDCEACVNGSSEGG